MEAKKLSKGDEVFYLSPDRTIVHRRTVAGFQYSADYKIVGVKMVDYWQTVTPYLILGQVIELTEDSPKEEVPVE